MNSPTLALSGSLFSVSGLVAYQYQNYSTAYVSCLLAMTSIWYHCQKSTPAYVIDQIALYSIVARSFLDGYSGGVPGILLACSINLYNYIIYYSPYSYYCCHHPSIRIGDRWHMSIHCLAVLGIILQQTWIKV